MHCSHRPPCPGCPRLGERLDTSPALVRLAAFGEAIGARLDAVHASPPTGFRHRARLAVRGRAASPKIGIFELGSHRVVDAPRCLVHHPVVNEVASAVKSAIVETRTPPYSDAAHAGLVRYLQITIERSSRKAQVVVVTNDHSPESARPLSRAIERRTGERLHGLFWNGQSERTNAIFGPRFERILGAAATCERIAGTAVFFPPGAFMQSNLEVAEALAATARSFVPGGARVLELYAGSGMLGLGLLERVASCTFNEVAPGGIEGLRLGLAAAEAEHAARATVVEGPAADRVSLIDSADAVVADPPRKGLDAPVLGRLVERPPERLVYVACGLDAFIRDARVLTERAFRLARLEAFDLFPHTEHIEALALFERTA